MPRLSRRKLATHVAGRIAKGETNDVLRELAAYLIENKRTRESELLIRDIEMMLLDLGTVLVTVTSARPLISDAKANIEAFARSHYPKVQKVELREEIDTHVIGGVKLQFADKTLDATIASKLEKMKV